MNRVFLVISVLVAILALSVADEKYTDKWDNIDLDEILRNDRLLKKYVDCLLADTDRGCTPDGKELKKNVPDALTNDCAKCTEKQKSGTEKVINYLIDNKPDIWNKLEAKYDPDGIYKKKYQQQGGTLATKL
ncbi:ejaculatory bulb-specific protein 3 [Anabrus simplex]|uniref:ejaculatory bulb-specific protein 3 n=1 Tax=Anabrus simplex TaxID=316456 RepID=UPI0035A395B8